MFRKLIALVSALTLSALAFVGFSSPASAAGPYSAPPSIWTSGTSSFPQVSAQNNRQFGDRTPIVLSSLTPGVCKVPANSLVAGTYQDTARVAVQVLASGTCKIAADQAASAYYVAGHSERSFSVSAR